MKMKVIRNDSCTSMINWCWPKDHSRVTMSLMIMIMIITMIVIMIMIMSMIMIITMIVVLTNNHPVQIGQNRDIRIVLGL